MLPPDVTCRRTTWEGGSSAICAALAVSPAVQRVQLAGNGLEEQAAQCLAELLLAHTGLKSLDLSYNQLNDQAGRVIQLPAPGVTTAALLIVFLGQAGRRWAESHSVSVLAFLSLHLCPGLSARSPKTSLCPALPVGPDGH